MKTIPCKFPDELAKKVRIIAASEGISVSEFIRRAVIKYLEGFDIGVIIKSVKD